MIAPPAPGAGFGSIWLIAPADERRRCQSARHAGADVAVLDLEDSVAPHRKDAARAAAIDLLAETGSAGGGAEGTAPVGLRLNAPSTLAGLRDLIAVAEADIRPQVLLVPKVESPRDVELAAAAAGQAPPYIWALIETPRAIRRLDAIMASDALSGVVFGAADYAAVAGCARNRSALWYPRAALAAAAAAAALPAIDSPWFNLEDADGLRAETEQARDLGFTGKGAVHPRQLATIRAVFAPSPEDLAAAQAVLAAADTTDGSIVTVSGRMVGPPLVDEARTITARAASAAGPASVGGPA